MESTMESTTTSSSSLPPIGKEEDANSTSKKNDSSKGTESLLPSSARSSVGAISATPRTPLLILIGAYHYSPCTVTVAPNLITVLLHKGGGFSVEIVRTITALLTFKKMSALVSMSKEAYEAKLVLFKAPKEWVDGDEVRMMFRAMLGTVESQWKRRN